MHVQAYQWDRGHCVANVTYFWMRMSLGTLWEWINGERVRIQHTSVHHKFCWWSQPELEAIQNKGILLKSKFWKRWKLILHSIIGCHGDAINQSCNQKILQGYFHARTMPYWTDQIHVSTHESPDCWLITRTTYMQVCLCCNQKLVIGESWWVLLRLFVRQFV